jgi:hypothetical protein
MRMHRSCVYVCYYRYISRWPALPGQLPLFMGEAAQALMLSSKGASHHRPRHRTHALTPLTTANRQVSPSQGDTTCLLRTYPVAGSAD